MIKHHFVKCLIEFKCIIVSGDFLTEIQMGGFEEAELKRAHAIKNKAYFAEMFLSILGKSNFEGQV